MAIKPLKEVFTNRNPKNVLEGIGAAIGAYTCGSANTLKTVASNTFNLPLSALADFWIENACPGANLPSPNLPVANIAGGQCPVPYIVQVRRRVTNTDSCSVVIDRTETINVTGPVKVEYRAGASANTLCLGSPPRLVTEKEIVIKNGSNATVAVFSGGFEGLGDFAFVSSITPVTGADNCGNPVTQYIPYPTPELPPGWPENPSLPPRVIPQKIFPTPPFVVPVFIFPKIEIPILPGLTANVPVDLSFPITFPVTFDFGGNTFLLEAQIDADGNYRDGEDVKKPLPPAVVCPTTTQFDVPFFQCGSSPGFDSRTLTVVESSIPPGLFDSLLSSANLAEIGCESLSPEQKPPAMIASARTGSVILEPFFTPELEEEVVSVELRITEFSPIQHRELTTFPGAGQRKFGVVSWGLAELEGGGDQVYIWDEKTYIRLPKRLKPLRLKVLLKESISFEVWDTGERVS